jgi:hypothetical protein
MAPTRLQRHPRLTLGLALRRARLLPSIPSSNDWASRHLLLYAFAVGHFLSSEAFWQRSHYSSRSEKLERLSL